MDDDHIITSRFIPLRVYEMSITAVYTYNIYILRSYF